MITRNAQPTTLSYIISLADTESVDDYQSAI
jgi:hypothetical protein